MGRPGRHIVSSQENGLGHQPWLRTRQQVALASCPRFEGGTPSTQGPRRGGHFSFRHQLRSGPATRKYTCAGGRGSQKVRKSGKLHESVLDRRTLPLYNELQDWRSGQGHACRAMQDTRLHDLSRHAPAPDAGGAGWFRRSHTIGPPDARSKRTRRRAAPKRSSQGEMG